MVAVAPVVAVVRVAVPRVAMVARPLRRPLPPQAPEPRGLLIRNAETKDRIEHDE